MGIIFFILTWLGIFSVAFNHRNFVFSFFFPLKEYSKTVSLSLLSLISFFIVSALIIINIELLSFLNILSSLSLIIFWSTTTILSLFISRKYFLSSFQLLFKELKKQIASFNFLAYALLFYILILFVLAIASPPNGWDSMTYHLARTVHWTENANVNHYPTHIIRQLFQPPFCEYFILNLNLLSNSDLLANFVQYLHFLLSIPALYLLYYSITGKKNFWKIGIVYATIPMVILHACSTQNDLSFGFWFICSLFLIFNLIIHAFQFNYWYWLLIGFTLGIGFLVKGTSVFYLSPLLVVFVIFTLKNLNISTLKKASFCLLIFVCVIASHSYRNYKTFGTIAGGSKEQVALYRNEAIRPNIAISNTIRNFCLHLSTPFHGLNAKVEYLLEKFHSKILRLDINDKRSTYIESSFAFGAVGLGFNEVSSSNFVHALLILLSLFFIRSIAKNKMMLTYFLVVVSGFFCLALALKWQHSYSRLHTPFFMAYIPIIVYLIDRFRKQFIAYLLLFLGLPWLCMNNLHPLFSHPDFGPISAEKSIFTEENVLLRFKNNEKIAKDYFETLMSLNSEHPQSVGVITEDNDFDYMIWHYLHSTTNFKYYHILVKNESKKYDYMNDGKIPDYIITTVNKGPAIHYLNREYTLLKQGSSIFVYK